MTLCDLDSVSTSFHASQHVPEQIPTDRNRKGSSVASAYMTSSRDGRKRWGEEKKKIVFHRLRFLERKTPNSDVHSVKLRRSTLRDLLDTKLTELSLQLIELFREIILALSPELGGLDLGARLFSQ